MRNPIFRSKISIFCVQKGKIRKNEFLNILFFLIFLFWTEKLLIFDPKIGFLVKNCIYSLIPRSKLANPGQNLKKFIF